MKSANAVAVHIIVVTICAVVAACAPRPQVVEILSEYDPAEVSFVHNEGDNTIRGQGFMRQRGGDVVTCAGEEVWVVPVGAYSKELFLRLYGTIHGVAVNSKAQEIKEPDTRYLLDRIRTRCDAQGKFTFKEVADGDYFVTTQIWWEIPDLNSFEGTSVEGGAIMARVEISGGKEMNLILAP